MSGQSQTGGWPGICEGHEQLEGTIIAYAKIAILATTRAMPGKYRSILRTVRDSGGACFGVSVLVGREKGMSSGPSSREKGPPKVEDGRVQAFFIRARAT